MTSPDSGHGDEDTGLAIPRATERVGWVLRLSLLVLVSLLVVATPKQASSLVWVLLLAVEAIPAWAPPRYPLLPPLGRLAEVVITTLGASTIAANHPGQPASALLPYLTVPVILPALAGRIRESLALLGVAAGLLFLTGLADGGTGPTYWLSSIEWLTIAGLSAGFVHSVQDRLGPAADAGPQPYVEATRLLTQLRTVARQLPGATLDPGGIAEHLIEELRAAVTVARAAVLSASAGGRLVVLAQFGADRVDWETSLDADSAIADAWATQQPQVSSRSQARTGTPSAEVSSLVVPLVSGVRTVGLITMEADRAGAYPPGLVARIVGLATPAAFRLEAALLFDDVRSLATNEERQRLAREIHDGVAQELVMVGYGIDNALATLPDGAGETADELRTLRAEVTRVITELRLSLFELRSDVERQGGLSAAISEYARTVGNAGGMRVHYTVVDSTARLPASVEAELMRIAQEAITNARKHAGAKNLWVSCEIDPPYARIEISDDGAGIGPQRPEGRFGLAIMAERAERIRGQLEITPRESGGTSVAVVLGAAHRRSTL